SPDSMPTHYSFRGGYFSRESDALYDDIVKRGREAVLADRSRQLTAEQHRKSAIGMEGAVRSTIGRLDERGRWLNDGWIQTRDFARNLETLARYLNHLRLAKIKAKPGPDLMVRRSEVTYDSQAAKLTVAVRGAGATAPQRVTVTVYLDDTKLGDASIAVPTEGPGLAEFRCRRAAPNATLRIVLDPEGRIDEPDEANNEAIVPMWEALSAAGACYAKLAADVRRGEPIVIEAESLERQSKTRVEIIKGASGGRAIRLLDETSVAEGDVEVPAGLYLATMVGMGVAADKDAAYVTVGEVRFRGFFGTGVWKERPDDPPVVNVTGGKVHVKVTYDEPETLIDKVLLYRRR
ncbi:MAG: CARDB domain-containing protein, partial [Armatimonadota bacterium]